MRLHVEPEDTIQVLPGSVTGTNGWRCTSEFNTIQLAANKCKMHQVFDWLVSGK